MNFECNISFKGKKPLGLLLLIASLLFTPFVVAKQQNDFKVRYVKAQTPDETAIKQWLENAPEIETVAELINEELALEESLTLIFGETEGPLFDSELNKIFIPYHFITEVEARFKQAKYQHESGLKLKQLVMDAILHTIFHELAHALISQFELPVLGKEEDAADGLASVFLIEYYDQGQEILITAADLFDLESQDIEVFEKQDFWGEHSLDIQRYYNSMCHVYGSAPEQYSKIKKDEGFTDEKAENCIDEYTILVNSWLVLLEPYLNNQG